MKKLLIMLLFIVFMAQPVLGAFTRSISTRRTYKNAYRWTGKPRDFILEWAEEVEDRLTGESEVEFIFFDPTDTEPGTDKGMMYMDESESKLKFYNGSSWTAIESGSAGNSLDGAYDVGRTISVDAGAVILTATNAADNVVLALVQSDSGTTKAVTITNAGTGNTIDIQGQSSSNDIEGTDDSWAVSSAGALTLLGFTTATTGDCLFDDTFDVAWDSSRDTLIFQDNSILGLGGAHDAAPDFAISHDGTDVDVEAAADGAIWKWGNGTNDIDMWWYGSAVGDYFWWDESAAELLFVDAHIGLADDGTLTFGTDDDFVISSAADGILVIAPDAIGNEIRFGTDETDAVVMTWYSDSAGDTVVFNEEDIRVEFEDVALLMMDATQLQFGDGADFGIHSTTAKKLQFSPAANTDDYEVLLGVDQSGVDLKIFGATTGEYWLFDASADSVLPVLGNYLFTATDAEANQFKVDATGATADAVAISLDTTDGKILLDADGATGGDIELNSADDIILTTAGKLTITNGSEAMTVSGALTVAGIATFNGTIVGDGATTVVGTKAVATTDIDNETVTIAQSMTTFNNTGDADGTTFTLPEASTAKGCRYTFVVSETGQQIAVDLDGADVFLHLSLGAGDKMTSSTLGDTITVEAVSDSQWAIISVYPLAADWADGGA